MLGLQGYWGVTPVVIVHVNCGLGLIAGGWSY